MKRSRNSDNLVKLQEGESDPAPDSTLKPGDDEDVDKDEDDSAMSQRNKKSKVELTESDSESHGSTLNGKTKEAIEKSVEVDNCQSGVSLEDKLKLLVLCSYINIRLEKSWETVPKKDCHILLGLRIAPDEASRLRDEYLKSLLMDRKLHLVLELDHTLLNSAGYGELTEKESYLDNKTTDNMHGEYKDSLYRVDSLKMFTKLRPFVHNFLKEASPLFEMSIYTMANRVHALEMKELLDPGNVYFKSRVIAQEDSSQVDKKGLDVVKVQESVVLILDVTDSVWENHLENLIKMDKYHFFALSHIKDGRDGGESYAELRSDESEEKRNLAYILEVLKKVHGLFFDKEEFSEDLLNRDVRQILKAVKKEVLEGCKIVFRNVFPPDVNPEDDPLWKTAEEFGASCSKEVDSTVTHVISKNVGTVESKWALKEKKFLVSPEWLDYSFYAWQKQPEEKYLVNLEEVKKEQ